MKQQTSTSLVVFIIIGAVFSSPIKDGEVVAAVMVTKNYTFIENNGQYPFMVSVANGEQHVCGGSIVKPFFVLTAAHCFKDKVSKKWIVRAGSFLKNDNIKSNKFLQVREVARFVIHEKYDQAYNIKPDIALIKLKKRFNFDQIVNAIQLPKQKKAKKIIDDKLTILGFGEQMEGVKSKYLRRGKVVVDSNKFLLCGHLIYTQMCVLGDNSNNGVLNGDSGGPLIKEQPGEPHSTLLVGIASSALVKKSTGLALIHAPSIFVEVATMRKWIDDTIIKLQNV